jgi:hypothetical protein
MRIIVGLIILASWGAVWFYTGRPRAISAPPTKLARIKKVLQILFCVFVTLGAFWMEIEQAYLSSQISGADTTMRHDQAQQNSIRHSAGST